MSLRKLSGIGLPKVWSAYLPSWEVAVQGTSEPCSWGSVLLRRILREENDLVNRLIRQGNSVQSIFKHAQLCPTEAEQHSHRKKSRKVPRVQTSAVPRWMNDVLRTPLKQGSSSVQDMWNSLLRGDSNGGEQKDDTHDDVFSAYNEMSIEWITANHASPMMSVYPPADIYEQSPPPLRVYLGGPCVIAVTCGAEDKSPPGTVVIPHGAIIVQDPLPSSTSTRSPDDEAQQPTQWQFGIRRSSSVPMQVSAKSEDNKESSSNEPPLRKRGLSVCLTFRRRKDVTDYTPVDQVLQFARYFRVNVAGEKKRTGAVKSGLVKVSKGIPIHQPEGLSSNEVAGDMENRHVRTFYNAIADHFSQTRHTPWPKVAEWVRSLPSGASLLDVGCGNGKYMAVNEKLQVVGVDNSIRLVEICRKRGFTAYEASALALPFPSRSFDFVMCIAVLHHITNPSRRRQVLQELCAVCKPGGRVLVSVWAQEQTGDLSTILTSKRRFPTQDVYVPWRVPKQMEERVVKEVWGDDTEHGKECKEGACSQPNKEVCTQQTSNSEGTKSVSSKATNSPEQLSSSGKGSSSSPSRMGEESSTAESQTHSKTKEESKACEGDQKPPLLKREGDGYVLYRYCHVYRRGELEELVNELERPQRTQTGELLEVPESSYTPETPAGGERQQEQESKVWVRVVRSYYDRGNWCCEIERVR